MRIGKKNITQENTVLHILQLEKTVFLFHQPVNLRLSVCIFVCFKSTRIESTKVI